MWMAVLPALFPFLAALLFAYLAWVRPDRYVRSWLGFWLALGVRGVALGWNAAQPNALAQGIAAAALAAAATLLLLGVRQLRGVTAQERNYLWLATVGAALAYVTESSHWAHGAGWAALFGVVVLAVATVDLLVASPRAAGARRLLAGGIVVWGLAAAWAWHRPGGLTAGLPPLAALLLAGLLVAVVAEQERRATEEHLFGLSRLNLDAGRNATDSLDAVMDGLMDRARGLLPTGSLALFLSSPLPAPMTLVRGFSSDCRRFLADTGGEIARLLDRYGGVVVGRWRGANGRIAGLETEPFWARLQAKLAAEGETAFACLSLSSRHGPVGWLLLARPERRRFLPGELRLLLALSTQTGVAIENLTLIRQSQRRGGEFEILTHIGTAISSSLALDDLLQLIHAELRKLLDVRNFFAALQMEGSEDLYFEFEVEDGVTLPKRDRPEWHPLAAQVLRTGQPLLLRHGEAGFTGPQALGRNGRPPQSWLGVPILIAGRPAGVLAVQNFEEAGRYDQDHLRILEVVAGQAAVAIENTRLFTDQQRNAKQLEFLNQIAKIAIASTKVEAMLQDMTEAICQHMPCKYIGIGVINYQSKELEFKAEAGNPDAAATGPLRRVPLGMGIVGAAARTGQLMLIPDLRQNAQAIPVHADSGAALAIPIVYAGQTLGVLNLESAAPRAFAPDRVHVLRTLADQIAIALNNSLGFQQMQQQAITDGLTGLKTRRYFMEELQREWKRSSRSGRPFSVVLIDLDNFKNINDTHGHMEGDMTLVHLARVLQQKCRGSNTLARYGGDEFTILMPEGNAQMASSLCDRLKVWLATDSKLSDRQLTASFGVASYPEHGTTPEEVLRAADVSMYAAKGAGGNQVMAQVEAGAAPATPPPDQTNFVAALPALFALTVAIDSKDALGAEHSLRVSRYAALLAQALKLSEEDQEQIRIAGRLHDIGKSAISAELLRKQELTPSEWGLLRSHPLTGAEMVAGLRGGEGVASLIAAHHEWFDGSGYPRGLRGDDIPLGGRILALAEAFDAMTSSTSHRPALTYAEASLEVERGAGRQFDQLLVRAFLRALHEETQVHAFAGLP
ncbi:MAG: diguanylate cyclase [Terriglobales bacterium]